MDRVSETDDFLSQRFNKIPCQLSCTLVVAYLSYISKNHQSTAITIFLIRSQIFTVLKIIKVNGFFAEELAEGKSKFQNNFHTKILPEFHNKQRKSLVSSTINIENKTRI